MELETITEGRTLLKVPKTRGQPSSRDPVFYNPAMQLSRDLTVSSLVQYDPKIVCDPLAGVGARGIRIAVELNPEVTVLNDLNPRAVELIEENVRLNDVEDVCRVENRDANALMHEDELSGRFDYVDIDPFGPPVPFLDAAVRTVRNRGVIGVSATDVSALAGRYPSSARRKYWVEVERVEFYQEVAIRTLISYIVRTCAKYDLAFEPHIAFFQRHHVRVIGEIQRGARRADRALKQLGHLLHCRECGYTSEREFDRECPRCGSGSVVRLGPLWLPDFADRERAERGASDARELGFEEASELLETVAEEVGTNPWAYDIHRWASRLGLSRVPSLTSVLEGLREEGFNAVRPHYSKRAVVKTDAGPEEFEAVLTEVAGDSGCLRK
ncbi:hypothetical protein [Methanopyrus sp. SNP6]|uniref:hypothetical protein n=1 Tax=Methanopyrus sp. SNP6 TaxID=1937005 RepID=UPI0011E5EEC3|nr:hypothetical protein [Methanopyrus sp. SNP6]